jgi:hypothetical protein
VTLATGGASLLISCIKIYPYYKHNIKDITMKQRLATEDERLMILDCAEANSQCNESMIPTYTNAAIFAVDEFGRNPGTTTLFIVVIYGSHLEDVMLEGYVFDSKTKQIKPFDGNNFNGFWQGK